MTNPIVFKLVENEFGRAIAVLFPIVFLTDDGRSATTHLTLTCTN